ncbi:MAG: hypothetical protein HY332_23885 [Chloroflexi bacterium]|nr:hypothetical protein [Chloroflexota bacterium]
MRAPAGNLAPIGGASVDVVGLDESGQAVLTGECKWHMRPFSWEELQRYLDHVRALGARVRPDVLHLLFSRSGFAESVARWAAGNRAMLLTPKELLAPFQSLGSLQR